MLAAIKVRLVGSHNKIGASFTWNDGGDEVLTVSVDEDMSTATILQDRSFHDLVQDDVEGEVAIEMDGEVVDYPRALVLPRPVGLELLEQMPLFEEIVGRYNWRVQD